LNSSHPLGSLEVESAWRLVSSTRWYCCSRIMFWSFWCAWSTKLI